MLAFFDDVYIVCSPARARAVFDLLRRNLSARTRVDLNQGKTRVWNRSGIEPEGVRELGSADDPVWVGDQSPPRRKQGMEVLGTPLGTLTMAPLSSAPYTLSTSSFSAVSPLSRTAGRLAHPEPVRISTC